jgi:hypothetical protein
MGAMYESFKINKSYKLSVEKMPLNNGFYNTLVDNETQNDLVYLFVGVANFPYLGKIGNLNQTTYFES